MTSTPDANGHRDLKPLLFPGLVFLACAIIFVVLRSKDFFTVDGAFRCFDVYRRSYLYFDANNHLLFTANVFAWTRLLSALGFDLRAPLQYFRAVEVMNCLAGAGCLAILCSLFYEITSSWIWSLGGTLAFALCKAFIAQATSSNQPIVGVFWSFLALLLAVQFLKHKSLWLICMSGAIFALALATYQSTIFLGFVVVLLLFLCQPRGTGSSYFGRSQILALGGFVLSGFALSAVIFGWAYSHMGFLGARAMVRHFFWHEETNAYLGISISKILNVPIGMLRSIFPILPLYNGIRGFRETGAITILVFLLLAVNVAGLSLCYGVLAWRGRMDLTRFERIGLISAAVGFLFTVIPVFVYDPQYDKLWIQPLACFVVFWIVSLRAVSRHSGTFAALSKTISVVLLFGVSLNLVWVFKAHVREPFELNEAERASSMIGSQDLLIGDWDQISVLCGSLWLNDNQFFSFTTAAETGGAEAVGRLQELVSETTQRGGRVYFLSILDVPQSTWDSFIGGRWGVPYSSLNLYREHSSVRATFKTRLGSVKLRELDAGLLQ